jgi:hypothetical protein
MGRRLRFLILSMTLLVAAPAWALILPQLSLDELVRRSDAVVRGTVTATRSAWDDQHYKIYTYCTVKVAGAAFGARRDQELTVKLLGGTVGDTSLTVDGNASLEKGEDVLLFLRTDGQYHYVVGMHLGKRSVVNQDGRELLLAEPPHEGLSAEALEQAPTLDELWGRVRDLRRALEAERKTGGAK